MTSLIFFPLFFCMSLKAALRAAHAALASGQLDEALERCQKPSLSASQRRRVPVSEGGREGEKE